MRMEDMTTKSFEVLREGEADARSGKLKCFRLVKILFSVIFTEVIMVYNFV